MQTRHILIFPVRSEKWRFQRTPSNGKSYKWWSNNELIKVLINNDNQYQLIDRFVNWPGRSASRSAAPSIALQPDCCGAVVSSRRSGEFAVPRPSRRGCSGSDLASANPPPFSVVPSLGVTTAKQRSCRGSPTPICGHSKQLCGLSLYVMRYSSVKWQEFAFPVSY